MPLPSTAFLLFSACLFLSSWQQGSADAVAAVFSKIVTAVMAEHHSSVRCSFIPVNEAESRRIVREGKAICRLSDERFSRREVDDLREYMRTALNCALAD